MHSDDFNFWSIHRKAPRVMKARATLIGFTAVLMWGLGNEMEGYGAGDNAAIWSAIINLAVMVKKLDPNVSSVAGSCSPVT